MAGNGRKWPEMAGNGWKWPEWLEMAGNEWKWMEIDGMTDKTSQLYNWFKSYGVFTEWVDFAYWRSCTRMGLRLRPAKQAYSIYITLRATQLSNNNLFFISY